MKLLALFSGPAQFYSTTASADKVGRAWVRG